MVHRPSDSRLLVNLLSHEKDYSKQLSILLESSQASLASFSAYASASAPPASQIIIRVAGALAGADEGLRNYSVSLGQWQEQLKSLRDLEEEVGNIMRDREILVTRLIKVSKNQKTTRDTLLAAGSSSSSSLSFSKPEVQIGSKLAAAQSQLQACEGHLAAKERELDVMRTAAVRRGLQLRCTALVECGWTWGEMGKEGLRALETLDASHPVPHVSPENGHASDLSSIGPSQSASQNTHVYDGPPAPPKPRPFTLHIPPAHSISDNTFPNGTVHYEQEFESGAGSSAEEEDVQYEVRENERFVAKGKGMARNRSPPASTVDANKRLHFPSSSSASQIPDRKGQKNRQRTGSLSVFGSIAAFFHHKGGSQVDGEDSSPTKSASRARWHTRTDKNLAHGKGDSSDDEARPSTYPRSMPASPFKMMTDSPSLTDASAGPNSQRLKKRPAKRGTLPAIASPLASTSTTILGQASQARVEDRGWASDPQTPNGNAASTAREKKRRKVTKQPSAASQSTMRERKGKEILELSENEKTPAPANNNQGKKLNWTALPATLPTEVALSRNSSLSKRSITSAASAPGGLSAHLPLTIHPATPVKHTSSGSGLHRRAMSLDSNPTSNTSSNTIPKSKSSKGHKKVLSNAGHPPIRRGGVDTTRTNGEPSLMSIVEGVAGQNRASRALQDPNSMLFLPKAPPPVSQSIDFDELAKPADDPATPTIQKRKPKQDKRERSPAIVRNSSERSVPITPSVSAPVAPTVHVPSPKLKPLRSALRNTSRSPSPDLSLSAPLPPSLSKRHFLSDGPAPAPQVELTQEGQSEDHDDESSVSSYETTREALDDDEVDETNHIDRVLSSSPPSETSPPPPPPKTDVPTAAMGGSESSQTSGSTATTSTAIGTQPTRRKSVRMSLPPTFSTTPPALDDDSDGDRGRKHEPWSSPRRRSSGFGSHTESHSQAVGWSSRIKDPAQKDHDTWKDSSEEEDEEYGKAKRLLSRFSTGKKNH